MLRFRTLNMAIIISVAVCVLWACGSDPNISNSFTPTPTTQGNGQQDAPSMEANGVSTPSLNDSSVEITTRGPSETDVLPTSTLYAVDKPTPTPLASAICSFGNTNRLIFQSFEEKRGELHACNAEFAWPVGYEIDVEKLAFRGDTSTGGEVGVARTRIAATNTCAWMTYWYDSTRAGDAASADRAIQYILMILPYWNSEDPSDPSTADPIWTEPARLAELGDPSFMVQLVTGENCAGYREVRANP